MSRSEAVVIESIEVPEHLRFLFYIDILNKFLLLQCKHSKYMYARCLNFSMFYKVFGCIHACILHVLSVRLTRDYNYRPLFYLEKKTQFFKSVFYTFGSILTCSKQCNLTVWRSNSVFQFFRGKNSKVCLFGHQISGFEIFFYFPILYPSTIQVFSHIKFGNCTTSKTAR